jgi:predicted DNA-binding transcriptional regulator AlpA
MSDPHDTGKEPSTPQSSSINLLNLGGYMRRDELAQHLGVSVRTIDRWDDEGKGPRRLIIGRTILYNIDSVREWLLSREQEMKPPMKRQSRLSGLNSSVSRG